jgi:hypothetical protein
MKTLTVVLSALAFLGTSFQDKPKKRDLQDRKWIEGKIVCIGCHLESLERGADAQCTLHAKHAQGLLAKDGALWTFVDNERGHHLIVAKTLRDKEIQVYGWSWPKAQYIEAYKYRVKAGGDKWVVWDYCKTCGFEQGDNGDTGLCPECRE